MKASDARRALALALFAVTANSCAGALAGSAGSAPRELENHMKILEECGALRDTGLGDGGPYADGTCDGTDSQLADALATGFAGSSKPWDHIDRDLVKLAAEARAQRQFKLAQTLDDARTAFLGAERRWTDSVACLKGGDCAGRRQAMQLVLTELVASSRALGVELRSPSSPQDASANLRASFALRELTAFGGVVRDGMALSRIKDPDARMRMLQPEAFVDVLVLWIEGALRRLDRTVQKLDEQTHGAGSIGLALGLDEAIGRELGEAASGVLDRYIRRVGRRRFKSRLCEIVVGKPSSIANSSVASALLLRLLADSDVRARRNAAGECGTEKTLVIADPETIASARWTARVQMADSNWARLHDPKRFLVQDMPLASDIPRALDASTLLAFAQTKQGASIDPEPAIDRFLLVQRAILQQPFAVRVDVHGPICTHQIPGDASGQPHRTTWLASTCVSLASPEPGAASAIAELAGIRDELACANAIRLRQAEMELACLGVTSNTAKSLDPSAIRCTAAGFQVVLESDHLGSAATSIWPPRNCETKVDQRDVPDRLARRIRSITGPVGAYKIPVERILFRGRASREEFKNVTAKGFLKCALNAFAGSQPPQKDCASRHAATKDALVWWRSTNAIAYLVNTQVTPDGLRSEINKYLADTDQQMDLHANDVLSLLRALRLASAVDPHGQLCGQGAESPCAVHGMGKDPGISSEGNKHCATRATDVVLETRQDLPCKQRAHP